MLSTKVEPPASSIENRGEKMPLGYVLRAGEILAYYGLERKDIAEAIFKYGRDRKTKMTTEPGTLGRGGGQKGFRSPDEILALARQALEGMEDAVPRRYPGFHGTLFRYPVAEGLRERAGERADLVIDIDVKGNYKEAFREGRKVLDFLDSYNVPYRAKFSGGSGPHIIIPYETFPPGLSGAMFERARRLLFQIISSRSRAGHIDGSFTSTDHFFRLPYSLNEITGLVSLPLRREQYDDFTPSMAEVPNVQVDDEWFQEPDEEAQKALVEMLQDNLKTRDMADVLKPTIPEPRRPRFEEAQRRLEEHRSRLDKLRSQVEEHMERLERLKELGAPNKVIRQERQMMQEAMNALKSRRGVRDVDGKFRNIFKRTSRSEDNNDR
jgi:hypothetical protein